jgi:hypothetical protein
VLRYGAPMLQTPTWIVRQHSVRVLSHSESLTELDDAARCKHLREGFAECTVRWLTTKGKKSHLEREPVEVHQDLLWARDRLEPEEMYLLLHLHHVTRTKATRSIIWPHLQRDYARVTGILNADDLPVAKSMLTTIVPWAFDRNGELYADIKDYLKHDPVSTSYLFVYYH